mgnify:CR=1 FL=1
MNITFITLYPDQLSAFLNRGVLKKAIESGTIVIECINLRSFADEPHYAVDDYPYSKRQGMVLKPDILQAAIASVPHSTIIMPDPKGHMFDHHRANSLSKDASLLFVCPAFEGVDERVFDLFNIERYRVADVIVPTGDTPAVVMAESIIRYLPDVLGCSQCVENDSLLSGLLEAPHYTSPKIIESLGVPDVLLSGHHSKIEDWKMAQSLSQTLFSRPDLINLFNFNEKLVTMIDQIVMEDHE